MRSGFDGAIKSGASEFALPGVERIAIERADSRDANPMRFCFVREAFGERFPVRVFDAAKAFLKPDPFNGTESEPVSPFQFINFAARQYANSHEPYLRRIALLCKAAQVSSAPDLRDCENHANRKGCALMKQCHQIKLFLSCICALLPACTTVKPGGAGDSGTPIVTSEFIFETAPFPSCHAST